MSVTENSKRNLRKQPRRDYKSMSRGEPEVIESLEENVPPGASGGFDSGEIPDKFGPGEGYIDTEDGNSDAEMANIKEEMGQLKQEEARLKKKTELQLMRKKLQEQREKVQNLRGTIVLQTQTSDKQSPVPPVRRKKLSTKTKSKSSEDTSWCGVDDNTGGAQQTQFDISLTDNVDLNALRKDKKLRQKARKELKFLALLSDSDADGSDGSSSGSYFDSGSDTANSESKKKKKKYKAKKSGINAKASDRVKHPQKWPHSHLQFEFVNKQVKYDELDFKLFVAGELEIISDPELSSSERLGRLTLLKKIVYYYSTYEFKGLKAFYAAWVREIELGKKSWSDDSAQIETAILSKYVLKTSKTRPSLSSATRKSDTQNDDDKVWFCQLYQRNKCLHKANHTETFKGKLRLAQHVCATCWLKDKQKLGHPECSSSCPHAAK